uniref:Uncharacterized protein n=1 Tax=Manihot esculenta TaxID=3983 RepID=A0A2C9V0C3_MANES
MDLVPHHLDGTYAVLSSSYKEEIAFLLKHGTRLPWLSLETHFK